ncbi:ANR family transcriptional regulator [Aggregatibacter kilianii]|uniref:ANR family transcriptional regulator n=1 Tax=Aggregatibacter kilianii TaxID=2025884 RepID=UPI000D64C660|nr:ANR family transcriptional regulator [Aggregatibacter kilianii]
MDERRKLYREYSDTAAELERAGNYAQAYSNWLKACLATNKSDEHNWCCARAEHCKKMAKTQH